MNDFHEFGYYFQGRKELATRLKTKGNSAYQLRNFADAAELYTRAIEVSPKSEPVFYSNRAACQLLFLSFSSPFPFFGFSPLFEED